MLDQNIQNSLRQTPETLNPQSGNNQAGQYLSPGSDVSISAPGSATNLLNSSSNVGINLNNVTPATLSTEFDTSHSVQPNNAPVIVGAVALAVIIGLAAYIFVKRKP